MNIENYENLANEVSRNLKEQGLTKGEIATVGYLLLSKNFNSITDEMKFNNNLESLLKKAKNLLVNCKHENAFYYNQYKDDYEGRVYDEIFCPDCKKFWDERCRLGNHMYPKGKLSEHD